MIELKMNHFWIYLVIVVIWNYEEDEKALSNVYECFMAVQSMQ